MFNLAAAFVKLPSFATVMKTFKRKSSSISMYISGKNIKYIYYIC